MNVTIQEIIDQIKEAALKDHKKSAIANVARQLECGPTVQDVLQAAIRQVQNANYQPSTVWVSVPKRIPRKLKKRMKREGKYDVFHLMNV